MVEAKIVIFFEENKYKLHIIKKHKINPKRNDINAIPSRSVIKRFN